MSEKEEILAALEEAGRAGRQAAVATVVRVHGSAYRREGTKMVIDEAGRMTCMISGGCLEPEIAETAKQVMEQGEAEMRHLDLNEDVVWGLGIGCGGTIDVYVEPVERGPEMAAWLETVKREQAGVLATVIGASAGAGVRSGARYYVPETGPAVGRLGEERLEQGVKEAAREKLGQLDPRSETRRMSLGEGEWAEVFIDVNVPRPEIVMFGAGHDAMPLAALGVQQGYRVKVVDARGGFLTEERFGGAELVEAHAGEYEEKVKLGRRSYVVIMNHHLERDRASLRYALETEAAYIGVLGPGSRYQRLMEELRQEGYEARPEGLRRVYSPVGLDLGAETPEEVANSIMGEILAVRKGHRGGFLRERGGAVHAGRGK